MKRIIIIIIINRPADPGAAGCGGTPPVSMTSSSGRGALAAVSHGRPQARPRETVASDPLPPGHASRRPWQCQATGSNRPPVLFIPQPALGVPGRPCRQPRAACRQPRAPPLEFRCPGSLPLQQPSQCRRPVRLSRLLPTTLQSSGARRYDPAQHSCEEACCGHRLIHRESHPVMNAG